MGELSPFLVKRPGNEQGRVATSGFSPEGDYALVLGSDSRGYGSWLSPDDKFEVYQQDNASPGRLVRFRSRIRGSSKVPALTTGEPFALSDGHTLQLSIDGGSTQTITFDSGDFVSIGSATALEVRDAINAELIGAAASITGDDQVAIFSDGDGRGSRVEVVGGTGVAALGINELAWMARLLLGGSVVAEQEIKPGETRDLNDWAGNLASHADPVEVRFRLILVRK